MPTSFHDLRNRLLGACVDFLWRQWTALGVPGNVASGGDWIIDPEALVLMTTRVGRHDARLLDLSIDWLHSHGRGINLQRLERLDGQWPYADRRVLGAVAEILSGQSVLQKWRTLGRGDRRACEDEPLFISAEGASVPVFGEPDPRFMRHGLLRPVWEPRKVCKAPAAGRPGNLLWTLRALFGVNARAEIMGWLLTHETGHPAEIAKATGYFSKSIQTTLNEMEQSGQIRSAREGREKRFRLNREDWRFLMGRGGSREFPRWIAWPPICYYIHRTLELPEGMDDDAGDRLRAIQLRGFLDEVAPARGAGGLHPALEAHRDLTGSALEEAVCRDVESLARLLETDFRREGLESSGAGRLHD